jgi:hypothetical protein
LSALPVPVSPPNTKKKKLRTSPCRNRRRSGSSDACVKVEYPSTIQLIFPWIEIQM